MKDQKKFSWKESKAFCFSSEFCARQETEIVELFVRVNLSSQSRRDFMELFIVDRVINNAINIFRGVN